MRILSLTLLGVATLLGCAPTPPAPAPRAEPGDTAAVLRPDLRDELLAMERADQEAREWMKTAFRPGEPPDTAAFARFTARMDSVDAAHRARLKEIVRDYGWPGERLVGREGLHAVFLIAQHSDREPAFQTEFLAWLEPTYRAGRLFSEAGQWVALLTDRIRVNEGRPQLYGTQVSLENGGIVVDPIEDEARVDERRAALGMPPLAQYIALVRRMYGNPD